MKLFALAVAGLVVACDAKAALSFKPAPGTAAAAGRHFVPMHGKHSGQLLAQAPRRKLQGKHHAHPKKLAAKPTRRRLEAQDKAASAKPKPLAKSTRRRLQGGRWSWWGVNDRQENDEEDTTEEGETGETTDEGETTEDREEADTTEEEDGETTEEDGETTEEDGETTEEDGDTREEEEDLIMAMTELALKGDMPFCGDDWGFQEWCAHSWAQKRACIASEHVVEGAAEQIWSLQKEDEEDMPRTPVPRQMQDILSQLPGAVQGYQVFMVNAKDGTVMADGVGLGMTNIEEEDPELFEALLHEGFQYVMEADPYTGQVKKERLILAMGVPIHIEHDKPEEPIREPEPWSGGNYLTPRPNDRFASNMPPTLPPLRPMVAKYPTPRPEYDYDWGVGKDDYDWGVGKDDYDWGVDKDDYDWGVGKDDYDWDFDGDDWGVWPGFEEEFVIVATIVDMV